MVTAIFGVGLFVYLVIRIGAGALWKETVAVGWGMAVILVLGGVSHLTKSSAWRLTFPRDTRACIPTSRAFALRLVSEAMGQLGLPGQVVGEGVRISLLGTSIPLASRVASASIDRGLYTLSSIVVGVAGLIGAAVLFPLSHTWKVYSYACAGGMLALLLLVVLSVQRQWRVSAVVVRGLRRVPRLRRWLQGKEETISTAEEQLLTFHRDRPDDFWLALTLDFCGQLLAISEVYLLLWFMDSRIGFLSAFVFEAFTKLVNAIGGIVPGNVGTYEGGSMLIAKLFGVSSAVGLAVGVCRRVRALFWAGIGGLCMIAMARSRREKSNHVIDEPAGHSAAKVLRDHHMKHEETNSTTLIILPGGSGEQDGFTPALARIGTLPAVLRIALSAQSMGVHHTAMCVDAARSPLIKKRLQATRRCPDSLVWYDCIEPIDLAAVTRHLAGTGNIVIALGDRSYRPTVLRKAFEWPKLSGALTFCSGSEFVGLYVLSPSAAKELANHSGQISTFEELHRWLTTTSAVEVEEIGDDSWQKIGSPSDRIIAEKKLNTWLVKPTDGLFARMNRRVSIPISRWVVQFPVTPNMVTLFTLWVSFGAGLFFAYGGYWATLLGAVLSVWASILDGCDGEVARLKLQVTDFGCWLETICDYLYYVFVFGGMIVGLTRTMGMRFTLTWGPMLLLGAVSSFFAVGYARHHFSADRPEAFLGIWQKKAENRKSNPFLFVGRHCEFIIRRCFLPYAFLGFALLNIIPVAFVATAIGANVVWCIALYSCFTLSRQQMPASPGLSPAAGSAATT